MQPLPSFRDVGWPLQVVDEVEGLKEPWGGPSRGRPTKYITSQFYLQPIDMQQCSNMPPQMPRLTTSPLFCRTPPHWQWPHWSPPQLRSPYICSSQANRGWTTHIDMPCQCSTPCQCYYAMMRSLVSLVMYACPSHLAPPVIIWPQAYNVTP